MAKHRLVKLQLQAEYAGAGRILDVGFGANPNIFLKQATGLDISLPREKPENYSEMVLCNLNKENMPFADAAFDAVIAGDVIEHVENPSHFLREANRVLKIGGRLVISTPQANDWWTTLHNWFFRGLIRDPDHGEHLHNWTILDMTRLLKKNGFALNKIEGFYLRFPKVPIAFRVRHFPILSWQVFYIAEKIQPSDSTILTFTDGAWLTCEQ